VRCEDQIVSHHDAIGLDQLRKVADVVWHKRAEVKTALLVKRDRAAKVHRVGVQLLDGQF
jgi:hypothetical protein